MSTAAPAQILRVAQRGKRSPLAQRLLAAVQRRPLAWLFLGCLAVYLATGAYTVVCVDVGAAEEPAWALATHGSLNLANVPHHSIASMKREYFVHSGGIYSDRFPAAILYIVPAYWIAALLGLHGFSMVPGVVTSAVVAATTVVMMARVFARILERRPAVVATVFFAFGTGTWSLTAHAPWSHTYDQLLIAVALWACATGRNWLAALANGLLIPGRAVLAVTVAAFGIVLAWYRRSVRTLVLFGTLAVPGVIALYAYNHVVFDRWSYSNGHELGGEISPHPLKLPLNIFGTLVSPDRGILLLYPVLLLLLFTGRQAWRAANDWERTAALAGLVAALTQLTLNRYQGGDTFFGNRLMIEPLTLAAPLIARGVVIYARTHTNRFVPMMLVFGVIIHGMGAIFS